MIREAAEIFEPKLLKHHKDGLECLKAKVELAKVRIDPADGNVQTFTQKAILALHKRQLGKVIEDMGTWQSIQILRGIFS